jgi:carbonic anhydrase
MEYAVVVLKIKHIIVCGHYGCGGVRVAMENTEGGLVDNWLRHIRDVYLHHQKELEKIGDVDKRWHRLCELNVIGQVDNVAQTTVVQSAWKRGQELSVHGWVYGLHDGLLRDLDVSVNTAEKACPNA